MPTTRLLVISLLFVMPLSAQTLRIDSLRKALAGLENRQRVDCLNALGKEFNVGFIRTDSALQYARMAYQLATSIDYRSGQAVSLLTQGDVQGRLLGDMPQMERNSLQAIDLLQQANDPATLSTAWYTLSIAYNSGGKHHPALEAASRAKQLATMAGNKRALGWALEATGLIECHNGNYWKSFENMIESQQIGKEVHDSLLTATSLAFIGRCFNRVGDPQQALNYYHQSLLYATPFFLLWPHMEDMAYACLQLKQYDSVLYYQQKYLHNLAMITGEPEVRHKFDPFSWGYSVEVQLARKQYDTVIAALAPGLTALQEKGDVFPWLQSLLVLAKAYGAKGEKAIALRLSRQVLQAAQHMSSKQYERDASELMASLFEGMRQADSAYFYFKQYTAIKEAMDTTQFAQRTALYLAASAATSRISSLEKDRTINGQQLALQQKELQKQSQLNILLIVSLVIILLLFALLIRNIILQRSNEKLKHEQVQLALKRKSLELEMQALRAQMNPHFIFNCLSAIDNLMQTNQADKATAYLARFAHLIRGVLDSSKNNLVPFQKDFETLQLYLEMEQFRCNNKFSYSLDADRTLLDGDYKVPPLIIQPFVENAIHHGLLNKKGANRQLTVTARLQNDYIVYSVRDNGIGRKNAAILKERNRPEHQSYGIAITRERIQLHNRNNITSDVLITDLEEEGLASGTTAVVKINSLEF